MEFFRPVAKDPDFPSPLAMISLYSFLLSSFLPYEQIHASFRVSFSGPHINPPPPLSFLPLHLLQSPGRRRRTRPSLTVEPASFCSNPEAKEPTELIVEWESSSSSEVMGGGGGGPGYVAATGNIMTEEQILVLQKQISIYGTLSQQLADMHGAQAAQHDSTAGENLGALYGAGDPIMMVPGAGGGDRLVARHRWTPTPTQLVILEGIFDEGHGTPNKQRIKDIAAELSQHGQISETSVYNWFQNRRARWRQRRQQAAAGAADSSSSLPNASSNAESEAADAAAASQYDGSSNNASSISGASGDWDHMYFYGSIDHAEPCTGFDDEAF